MAERRLFDNGRHWLDAGLQDDPVAATAPEPLNVRLRAEAAEWDDGEDIVPLLLEAADVIERIVDAVAQAAVIGAKHARR